MKKAPFPLALFVTLVTTVLTPLSATPSKSPTLSLPDGFVVIKGGTFTIGSPVTEKDRGADETSCDIYVSRFALSKFEMTQAEWIRVMGSNPSEFKGDSLPVENVSWYAALVYCNKRSVLEGRTPCYTIKGSTDPAGWGTIPTSANDPSWDAAICNWWANGYRLPTEAEWEYACRAGSTSPYFWGSSPSSDCANGADIYDHWPRDGFKRTSPVGSKMANFWGLYDMAGNVEEWCWNPNSNYGVRYNPRGSGSVEYRMLRGGDWASEGSNLRSASRLRSAPFNKASGGTIGVRLACGGFPTESIPTTDAPPLPDNYILIRSGTFSMGSPSTEKDRSADEVPHTVTVSSYALSKFELTIAEWESVMGFIHGPSQDGGLPEQNVSWYSALVYCNIRSIMEGRSPCYTINGSTDPEVWGPIPASVNNPIWDAAICDWSANGYRLPTEAEWEYACRAGSTSPYSWGSTPSAEYANGPDFGTWPNDGYKGRSPVGSKVANPWGLYDMSGNMMEWCWDWYGAYPTGVCVDPKGSTSGSSRVLRGSSFRGGPGLLRSASRDNFPPEFDDFRFGVRLVCGGAIAGGSSTPVLSRPETVPALPEGFITIKGGTFAMGSPASEGGRYDNEAPHTVTVSSFALAKCELTQAEWVRVMVSNPSDYEGEYLPVENMSWYFALVYCNKRSILEGRTPCFTIKGSTDPAVWGIIPTSANDPDWDAAICDWSADGFRLPTEAEWEYACRAGSTSPYYWGSNPSGDYANGSDFNGKWPEDGFDRTSPIGSKKANTWGLYDMTGNVWEWCWDWYGEYATSAAGDPRGATLGTSRVMRGGSMLNKSTSLRSARRDNLAPWNGGSSLGFRLALSITP